MVVEELLKDGESIPAGVEIREETLVSVTA